MPTLDIHQATTRAKAYDLCDEYLSLAYKYEGFTDEASQELATYLLDETSKHRDRMLCVMADRECVVTAHLLDAVRALLHHDDTFTRRMACLVLDGGGDAARAALFEEWQKLSGEREEDFIQLLRIAHGIHD